MEDIQFVRQQLPVVEMDEKHNHHPTVATIREIDAEAGGKWFSFFFSKANYFVDLTSYPGGFDRLLRDVHDPNFNFPDDTNRPDPPLTPLSLNNQGLTYIVYRLSDKNWQFCRNHPPFSMGPKLQGKEIYCEARRVTPWGTGERVVEVRPGEWEPVRDECSVAYFIADGWKAQGITGIYTHAINIHVDLVFPGQTPAYTPLIIDPDVRHPGGSGA